MALVRLGKADALRMAADEEFSAELTEFSQVKRNENAYLRKTMLGRLYSPYFLGLMMLWGHPFSPAMAKDPLKPGPAGIVCLMKANMVADPVTDLAADPCWTNPEVKAVMLRTQWNVVEPAEGRFNFSHFDEGVQLARKYGKKLGMSIGAGTMTPEWVYQAGAKPFYFNKERRLGDTSRLLMPLPWDPVFQSKWRALVKEFGLRYDSLPELAYVVMGGPGRQIETFFVDSPEDISEFNRNNGQQNWFDASRAIAGFYAASFPHTHFLYAIGPPTPTPEGRATISRLLEACASDYPGWFGVRCDGLRPRFGPDNPAGRAIQRFASTTTAGFQMSLPSKGGQAMGGGTLQDAFNFGISYGAQFIEVYRGDCSDPGQQPALHEANSQLEANAAKVQ
jgi:hypothetical protein